MPDIAPPSAVRTVHMLDGSTSWPAKSLYLDQANALLFPNVTFVQRDGSIFFETNEIGFKGDPVDPTRKLAVVWGDSVAFGNGWGWPRLIEKAVDGCQVLNGAIEGISYRQVLNRAVSLNQRHDFDVNIVMLGWHTIGQNENVKQNLIAAVRDLPNPVLLTLPSAFNRGMIEQDISAMIRQGGVEDAFVFVGWPYSVEQQKRIFEHVVERNEITREVAALAGLPLVDLFEVFDTENLPDIRRDFWDYMHPRPSAYERIAHAVASSIRGLL